MFSRMGFSCAPYPVRCQFSLLGRGSLLQGSGRMQHAFSLALFLDIRSFFVFLCSGTIVEIGPPSLRNIVNSLSSPFPHPCLVSAPRL